MGIMEVSLIVRGLGFLSLLAVVALILREQLKAKDGIIQKKEATIQHLEAQLAGAKEWQAPALAAKALQIKAQAEMLASEKLELQGRLNKAIVKASELQWVGYSMGLMDGLGALGLVENQVFRELSIEGNYVPSPAFMEKLRELSREISEGLRELREGRGRFLEIIDRFILDTHQVDADLARKEAATNSNRTIRGHSQ